MFEHFSNISILIRESATSVDHLSADTTASQPRPPANYWKHEILLSADDLHILNDLGGSIRGRAWVDSDADNVFDNHESALAGVTNIPGRQP